jgi:hypothetical protein
MLILTFMPLRTFGLGGGGTEVDPYRIESLLDFNEFASDANYWDDYTRLEIDVNLAGMTYSTAVIAPDMNNNSWTFDGFVYSGVFDGNKHKIINLNINTEDANNHYLGLFGKTDVNSAVKDLAVQDCNIISGENSERIGGLVGENYGTVLSCFVKGSISGGMGIGGLTGLNYGTISKSYTHCFISGSDMVGGLTGISYDSYIEACYAMGSVSGGTVVGGFIGDLGCYISDCYSTCYVSGDSDVGGFGGNIGFGLGTRTFNCFWDIQTSGTSIPLGNGGSGYPPIIGKSTADMKTLSTYTSASWDFLETWGIEDNQTYPFLKLTYPVSDIDLNKKVDLLDLGHLANHWLEEE